MTTLTNSRTFSMRTMFRTGIPTMLLILCASQVGCERGVLGTFSRKQISSIDGQPITHKTMTRRRMFESESDARMRELTESDPFLGMEEEFAMAHASQPHGYTIRPHAQPVPQDGTAAQFDSQVMPAGHESSTAGGAEVEWAVGTVASPATEMQTSRPRYPELFDPVLTPTGSASDDFSTTVHPPGVITIED